MFKIGDFSKIARVSGRLLRYYDSIGLLSPVRIDPATGYRYYSAGQLARLNRILALKGLGLTLEQVARLLDGNISSDEIRGMFLLKKAELERTVSEEAQRLRNVESRLQQIDEQGSVVDYDIIVKTIEPARYLSFRRAFASFGDALSAVGDVTRAAARQLPDRVRDALVVVAYSDFDDEDIDLEIGYTLKGKIDKSMVFGDGVELKTTELPGIDRMATLVRSGPAHKIHLAFGALGLWMEANRCEIAGPCREVFLQPPFQQPDPEHADIEIQFPVRAAAPDFLSRAEGSSTNQAKDSA